MGCPKSFSISGGMGAALLAKPELIHDVCSAYSLKKCLLSLFPLIFQKKLWFLLDSLPCLRAKPDSDNIKKELEDTCNV